MSQYSYSSQPLERGSIRLLRLLPHEDENAPLRGDLFSYSLDSDNRAHLYEALSYAWGSTEKPCIILMGQDELRITENLYNALRYLRNCFFDRIIWVDSVCIDQQNNQEKTDQILFMRHIFSQASHVIVWLGLAEDDGAQALKDICVAAEGKLTNSSISELKRNAIIRLLKRPWFQRIWVRKEKEKFILAEIY